MSYGGRRYSRKRGRSAGSLGGMVGESATIANKLGPRGALTTGLIGFTALYFIIPWLLVLWADHNKASMKGQMASVMGQLLDEIFIRRFIRPSEWAGIAVLLVCVGIATWKAFTRTDLDYRERRNVSALARLIARFLD